MADERARFSRTTPVPPMPYDCPKKSELVEAILAGKPYVYSAKPPKRKKFRGFVVQCPPPSECGTCDGGPCIWRKSSGGHA